MDLEKINESYRPGWETALSVLQPAKKDLERGLELHRASFVCDAYGFSPFAGSWTGTGSREVARAAAAGASDAEIENLSGDLAATLSAEEEPVRLHYQEAWNFSGVTCIVQNAGEEGSDITRLMKRLAYYTYISDLMPDFVVKAGRPEDLPKAKKQGKRCFYLTGNGVPLPQRWVSVEEELIYIRIFFQLGIRMMHLTYNRRNMIGDGCMEKSNAGLSDFGRAVVREMNRAGVIVDVAHSGWQTSLEAAQVSGRPMVVSHSVCAGLNPHRRSKPDEVIRAVADSGGFIGICCLPAFLGGTGDISAFLDHIDYVAKKFGVDHVAIGTDNAFICERPEPEKKAVSEPEQKPGKRRPAFEWFWYPDDPMFAPEWNQPRQKLSLSWTNWPLFTVGLVQRGYSDLDIQKIIGGNVLRVAQAVWPQGS